MKNPSKILLSICFQNLIFCDLITSEIINEFVQIFSTETILFFISNCINNIEKSASSYVYSFSYAYQYKYLRVMQNDEIVIKYFKP